MLRKSGFSTDGDIDNVLLVGPIAPATYLGIPVVERTKNTLRKTNKGHKYSYTTLG